MTWKASPRQEPNCVSASIWLGVALAHMAPRRSEAVRSAAVFAEWMKRRVAGEMGLPSCSRSRTWPAMSWVEPEAVASSRTSVAVG